MKRSRIKRGRPTGPDFLTVQKVLERDGGRCVRCGIELFGDRVENWAIHHRRGRDGKPDSHKPQNLITVCGTDNVTGCHGLIHQHPRSEGAPGGWWISRNTVATDPLTTPVLVDHGSRWVYLTASGEYADDPPEVA